MSLTDTARPFSTGLGEQVDEAAEAAQEQAEEAGEQIQEGVEEATGN